MSEDTRLKELIINTLSPEQFEPITPSETEIYLVEDDAEYATVEELATKQNIIDDLEQIRDNASTGANLAPQVAVNTQRIEDLTTAKFPNVVIVGTPHIEGGQVSNYSDTSYLQFPFVDISRGQPFDIYFSFTTSNDVTTQQNILDSYFGIALAIQNSKGIMALSSNGQSWDIGMATGTNTLLPNTTYYVKYSWTGTAYSAALSTDDQTYVPDMNLTSSLSPHKTTIFIGGSPNLFGASSAHPFKGTINFNKSKVVVNDITVWEGMADVGLASRANVSLNNLDEVGEARFNAKQDVITDLDSYIKNTDYATSSAGVVRVGSDFSTSTSSSGYLRAQTKTLTQYNTLNELAFIGKGTLENIKENLVTSIGDTKYQNKLTAGPNITIENDVISASGGGEENKRFLGETIFSSLPISEPSVHLLDGALLSKSGMYDKFIDYVAILKQTHPQAFVTEQEWQQSINTYGVCGKYVYDENEQTVRLPKVTGIIEGTIDANALNDLVEAGLPDHNHRERAYFEALGQVRNLATSNDNSGAAKGFNLPTSQLTSGLTPQRTEGASESNPIYGNSDTVQPQTIKQYIYIVVATSVQTQIEITSDIKLNNPYSLGDSKYSPQELNNLSWLISIGQMNDGTVYKGFYEYYANKIGEAFGLGEVKAIGDTTITDYDLVIDSTNSQFRLPLYDGSESLTGNIREDLTLLASGSTYTASHNGIVSVNKVSGGTSSIALAIANLTSGESSEKGVQAGTNNYGQSNSIMRVSVPVRKGDEFTVKYTATGTTNAFSLVYAKGNGNLYYYVGETVENADLIDAGRIQEEVAQIQENKVSKTGDVITGNLEIQGDYPNSRSFIVHNYIDINDTPTSNKYMNIAHIRHDEENSAGAEITAAYRTNKINSCYIQAYRTINGTKIYNALQCGVTSDGKKWYDPVQLITTYVSGTSGYNIWSNGYCEQWGSTMASTSTITFLKKFSAVPNMTWGFVTTRGSASYDGELFFRSVTATNFVTGSRLAEAISPGFMWKACGYLASGQY